LGWWEGLRAGWVFLLGGIVLLMRIRRLPAVLLSLLVIVMAIAAVRTAQDFGRALMFVAPAAVLGLLLARRNNSPSLRPALVGATLAGLLLPAHHVMSDRVTPIFYLYHELAAFESPPAAVMPEIHELRAIRAMQDGNFDEAESALTLAIRLTRHPAAPLKQRGILRASRGRWAEAGEDFARMAEEEPENPDAWFMCAQARLALNDSLTARTHMEHALSLAPADWKTRPDVARFLTRLEQSR
jgi:tetratricopeptide (TPR) repeat protein